MYFYSSVLLKENFNGDLGTYWYDNIVDIQAIEWQP